MRRRSRSLAVREEGVEGFGSEGDGVKRSRGPGEWLFAPSVKVSITIRDSFLRKGEKETEKGEDYFSLWNFKINRIFSVGKIGGIESGWYEFTNNDDKFKELARGPIEKIRISVLLIDPRFWRLKSRREGVLRTLPGWPRNPPREGEKSLCTSTRHGIYI